MLKEPFTLIYSTATQLLVNGGRDVEIHFLKYYPKCTKYAYQPVTDDSEVVCQLMDYSRGAISNLKNCKVEHGYLAEGRKYSVRVNHLVKTGSGLKDRTHYVGLQTETVETFCTFGFDELTVDQD